jgi:hypothetical protein
MTVGYISLIRSVIRVLSTRFQPRNLLGVEYLRKISTPPATDNLRLVAAVALTALLAVAGCGGGADDQADQTRTGTTDCRVVVDDQAVHAFYDLVDRVEAGEDVTIDDTIALCTTGALDRWRQTLAPEPNKPRWVGLMMFIGVVGEEKLDDSLRGKARQPNLISAFEQAVALRRYLEPRAAELMTGELLCRTETLLAEWAPADSLPAELPIDLVCARPEIRYYDGRVTLDVGLAWAAGDQQLPGFIASLVYKEIVHYPGLAPKEATGPGILMESWRIVHNLVVPARLERTEQIVFDKRHPLLAGNGPEPEAIAGQAHRTLQSLDGQLTRVRGFEAVTDDDWLLLYRLFVGAQSWQATGWYTGQVIERALGTERLKAASRHPADLLVAYQEAAQATTPDESELEGTVGWMLSRPPAFSADNFEWFESELRRYFP